MKKYLQDVVESMKAQNTGKTLSEVRWYFENPALSFLFFTNPAKIIKGVSEDPLYLFRLFDGMTKEMGFDDPYSFTPDMSYYGVLESGDQIVVITMPDPDEVGHAYAILMFADQNTDYPGYFLIERGEQGNEEALYLVAWDYQTNFYNLGVIDDPEEASTIAYERYIASRDAAMQG